MAKKQKGGGGKKGEGKAKKMDYLKRSSGSAIRGKNKKKTGGFITSKNKARRKAKHIKLVAKLAERKSVRLELTEKILERSQVRIGDLKKRYGTLNIRRLTDILDNTWRDSDWFKTRIARKTAIKEAKREERKRLRKKFRKNKLRKVPRRGSKRNSEISVDKK